MIGTPELMRVASSRFPVINSVEMSADRILSAHEEVRILEIVPIDEACKRYGFRIQPPTVRVGNYSSKKLYIGLVRMSLSTF